MVHITQKYSFVELMRGVDGVADKKVNSVPYRPVWPIYTVPVSAPVQVHPLFRTGKNIGRTGLIPAGPAKSGYFG